MALNIGTVTVKADVELAGKAARIIALQHAVDTHTPPEAPDSIVERAEAFRAFLEG